MAELVMDDWIDRFVENLHSTCTRCISRHEGWCQDLIKVAENMEGDAAYNLRDQIEKEGREAFTDCKILGKREDGEIEATWDVWATR